jgi:uncharacterized protein
MNISRSEQRTLHAMAQGGAIVLERDSDGRLLSVACMTRQGYLLTDCNLSVWRRLKKKGLIWSRDGGPYQINREGLTRLRSQVDNRVEPKRW